MESELGATCVLFSILVFGKLELVCRIRDLLGCSVCGGGDQCGVYRLDECNYLSLSVNKLSSSFGGRISSLVSFYLSFLV